MTYSIGHLSPLENRFNALIQQFVEHGFYKRFYGKYQMWFRNMKEFNMQEFSENNKQQTQISSAVSIDNLHDGILMLAVGWPLSIMVFVGEIMWKRYKNGNRHIIVNPYIS